MSGTTYHMSISVRGVINWPKRELQRATKWIKRPDGTRFTPEELRAAFMDELAQGREVLPMSECEGFDFKTGCPGHRATTTPTPAPATDATTMTAPCGGSHCEPSPKGKTVVHSLRSGETCDVLHDHPSATPEETHR